MVSLRVARAQLVHQHAGLCILAAQAQHGCACHVGMMNVAGEQAAERLRVLPRASAAALVGEEADAVEIGKDSIRREFAAAVGRVIPIAAAWRSTSWRTRGR